MRKNAGELEKLPETLRMQAISGSFFFLNLCADGGKNRLRCVLAEYACTDPGGMDAVHSEQAQVGIVNTAVVKIDDGSAVCRSDGLDLCVEIRYRIAVQVHGRSAGISLHIAKDALLSYAGCCLINALFLLFWVDRIDWAGTIFNNTMILMGLEILLYSRVSREYAQRIAQSEKLILQYRYQCFPE